MGRHWLTMPAIGSPCGFRLAIGSLCGLRLAIGSPCALKFAIGSLCAPSERCPKFKQKSVSMWLILASKIYRLRLSIRSMRQLMIYWYYQTSYPRTWFISYMWLHNLVYELRGSTTVKGQHHCNMVLPLNSGGGHRYKWNGSFRQWCYPLTVKGSHHCQKELFHWRFSTQRRFILSSIHPDANICSVGFLITSLKLCGSIA